VDANDPIVPFIRGGLGFYNVRARTESSLGRDDDASTDLGFLAGAGVEFSNWEGVAWGAELLYQYIATSGEASNLVTLRAQVMFGYPR
jgi:opacity protein-like surface antigen